MRDIKIDALRFIGLAMIILAHISPPYWLFQLRNFDVPLMLIVSGLAFALTYKPAESIITYWKKRLTRLVLPVWFFLLGYFVVNYFVSEKDYSLRVIASSFLLIQGIGHVWVIRVFILVALIAPWIFKFNQRCSDNKKYLLAVTSIFAIFECIRWFTIDYIDSGPLYFISLITHYMVPYGLMFSIGLALSQFSRELLVKLATMSIAAFICMVAGLYLWHGQFIPTQMFQYPPSIYYLLYSIIISLVLWLNIEKVTATILCKPLKPIVLFISANSIWVYLWHIPLLNAFEFNFFFNYLAVLVCATVLTYIQVALVTKLSELSFVNHGCKRYMRISLTG
ncbi:acyltransferase [Catenovulum sp. SM1970]|uniref:acyltransferase family protein n=1 Tax=Marinifaba aquimaris TaxID=2741323 RepID=UPI001571C0D2|nr:acyltransferase [Marinifaba aquimaris]NTS78282.1 acyltransferase [Marinifaba aquimaris]